MHYCHLMEVVELAQERDSRMWLLSALEAVGLRLSPSLLSASFVPLGKLLKLFISQFLSFLLGKMEMIK